MDPDDAVTWNNLGLLEEQMGYQEQARERYKVSDELLGILNEHGIDPESSSPAAQDRPSPSGTARTPALGLPNRKGVPLILERNEADRIDAARPRRAVDIHQEWLYLEGLMRRSSRPDSPTLDGTSFLDEVLEAILVHPLCEAQRLHRMAVVVPSHRAMSKLRKALQLQLSPPVRLPKFYALSGFVEGLRP